MSAGSKLAIVGLLLGGVTVAMAYLGAARSWQYYLTVDECLQRLATLPGYRIRVRGTIAANTLRLPPDRSGATFSLEGAEAELPVVCSGPLPDNLAEGIDVVVEGRVDESGVLRGERLLTRCASKYESRRPSGAPGDNGRTQRELAQ
jgi:cytochrome c-type biogenesis protein CcmE